MIMTPATDDEAPASLEATDNPIFNTPDIYSKVLATILPLTEVPGRFPIGGLSIGPRGDAPGFLETLNG
jgi:hypothetical protein